MARIMALKINNDTYPVYQASGVPVVYHLSWVNDFFVVNNPENPLVWEYYEERDFRKHYKFLQDPPLPTNKFSLVVRVENDDE